MKSQFRKHNKINFFNHLRYWFHKLRIGKMGKQVVIGKNVSLLRFPKNIFINDNVVVKDGANICSCNSNAIIKIGKNTTVGFYTFIYSSSSIQIGANCLIAPFVYIVDSNHQIKKNKLINQQDNISKKIIIGNDVWIGTGAKILMGTKIGNGAVISAGAIVNKDVDPYIIVGGVPAKIISTRK